MTRDEIRTLRTLIRSEIEAALEARFGPLPGAMPARNEPTPAPGDPNALSPDQHARIRAMVRESLDTPIEALRHLARDRIAALRAKPPRRKP